MLNGGSAKTRSIEPDSTCRKFSRQSPWTSWPEGEAGAGVSDIRSLLVALGRARLIVAVAVTVAVAMAAGAAALTALVAVDPVLGELLVQGVAVDAQAGGGLDLDPLARLQHL